MNLKQETEIRQMFEIGAAEGTQIRVDPSVLFSSISNAKLLRVLNELGATEGTDYLSGPKSKPYQSSGYIYWVTDKIAVGVFRIWRKVLSGAMQKQWTDEKASRLVSIIEKYAKLYPVTTNDDVAKSENDDEILECLNKILLKVEDHGIGLRKNFPAETAGLYAHFLAERRSGRCPISHMPLVDRDGKMLEGAEIDHFFSRSYNGINGGWIISSAENKKLRDPAYRATINTRFLAFQDELSQWMEDKSGPELDFKENDEVSDPSEGD
jgi:hypothetical protein